MAKALITGASSGIGATFAKHLANMGYDLILVARREERLQELANDVSVAVQIVVADLTIDDDLARVEAVIGAHADIAFLVNNAGFGNVSYFTESTLDKHLNMIDLHVKASIRLMYAVLPQMKQANHGAIINVASIGGLIPMPTSATYNATKAFLVSFSESLAMEVAEFGIVVQALCPGFTYTEIWDTAGFDDGGVPKIAWMSSDEVVVASLRAIPKKHYRVTPGLFYQIGWRLMQIPILHHGLKVFLNRSLK